MKKKDYKTALKAFKTLAKQGDGYSQMMVGAMYFGGNGVAKDNYEGLDWYKKAAKSGYTEAQFRLGSVLLSGVGGIPMDSAEGEKWLLTAAEKGHEEAQNFLALSYSTGMGLKKNNAQAYFWWTILSEHGKNKELKKEAKEHLGDPMSYSSYVTKLSSSDYNAMNKKAKNWKPKN